MLDFGNAGLLRQTSVQDQVPILAVGRQEICGPHEFEHVLIVLAPAVAADVDIAQLVVKHIDSLAEEVVHRTVEQFFVARNGHGAQNDGVAVSQRNLAMFAQAHAHHRAGRLPLAAGGDDDDLAGRQGIPFRRS